MDAVVSGKLDVRRVDGGDVFDARLLNLLVLGMRTDSGEPTADCALFSTGGCGVTYPKGEGIVGPSIDDERRPKVVAAADRVTLEADAREDGEVGAKGGGEDAAGTVGDDGETAWGGEGESVETAGEAGGAYPIMLGFGEMGGGRTNRAPLRLMRAERDGVPP